MPKVLIVEDDARIAEPLKQSLELDHFVVDVAQDGLEGWSYLTSSEYDLVVLDLNLPKLDGLSLCKRLRAQEIPVPVLMLTARDTTSDAIIGLESGADDYVVKPFELALLKARLRSLLRRPPAFRSTDLKFLDLRLDTATRQAYCFDQELQFTAKEYGILEYLARHPGQIFNKEQLLERLWGWESPQSDVIKAHIKTLRKKIKSAGGRDPIDTVFGFGYRLLSDE